LEDDMNHFPLLFSSMSAIGAGLGTALALGAFGARVRRGTLGALSFSLGLALFLALGSGFAPGLGNLAFASDGSSSAQGSGEVEKTLPAEASESEKIVEATEDPQPQPRVIIPPGRPEWVEQAPVRSGERHTQSVCSEPYRDLPAARAALDEKLQAAVQDYVSEQLGSPLAGTLIHYDLPTIKNRFLKSRYEEAIEVASLNAPMQQLHGQLEFGPSFRSEIAARWQKVLAAGRLGKLAVVVLGVLLLLGTVFSYFRLDNATRGYHTGRLQLLSAAAILALVAAGVLFARADAAAWLRAAANWEHHVSAYDCSGPNRSTAY
jgi:hypothetical protein